MDMKDIKEGDMLFWNDPDDGICSCVVKVKRKDDDTVYCEEVHGGEVEALPKELEPL